MVKLLVNKDDCDALIQGSLADIAVETALGIGAIYNTLVTAGRPDAAEKYRDGLLELMKPDSPIWQPREETVVIDMNAKKSDTPADQS